MLSSARREIARTEQMVELLKVISGEGRLLSQEYAKVRTTPTQVRALREDVDQIKVLLKRVREMSAGRRAGAALKQSPVDDDGPDAA